MSGRTDLRRAVRVTAAALAVVLSSSGCAVLGGGLRGVDLPGGADVGDDPYTVTVEFADVVDLVPQSLVKVADVDVGSVRTISLDPGSWQAVVTVVVNSGVELPANAQARVRTTSLLGEKFVELMPPAQGAQGVLKDGAKIGVDRSGRAVEIEEVFGSLSMLLNGGGVAQIQTIATELNNALKGNEPEIRSLLENLDKLVGALDDRKGDITKALDGLNRLSATLVEGKPKIEDALDDLGPGIQELADQREDLVDMLKALDRLSEVAVDVIDRGREDLLADLRLLTPTLRKLAESRQDLPNSLEVLGSPPFTDAAVDGFAGDYSNLYVDADLDLRDLVDNLLTGGLPALPASVASLFPALPTNAQLLSPLLNTPSAANLAAPEFPLLGAIPTPLAPGGRAAPAPAAAPAPSATRAPTTTRPNPTAPRSSAPSSPRPNPTPAPSTGTGPTPGPTRNDTGNGLGGLFGGGA